MKKFSTISIVTPSFNQGQYIEETIKSVLGQKGDFFIDYIIADGGSSDNTLAIMQKYDELVKSHQLRIKCLGIQYRFWSKKDKGQTDAINQGFKIAYGNILAWINSDDYFLPGSFQKIINTFNEEEIDFLYGDCFKIYPNKQTLSKPNCEETWKTLLSRGGSFEQQATFFTKKITEQVGYLDESLHYCMDYDLWIKIFQIGKIKYLPEALAAFRIWQDSKTSTSQKKFDDERRMIAKRYGGNYFTPKKVYWLIGKIPGRNLIKKFFPSLYKLMQKIFFSIIDIFKYKKK